MNLKIELKDSKKCDGCPIYYALNEFVLVCPKYGELKTKNNPRTYEVIRPKKCIKENGE